MRMAISWSSLMLAAIALASVGCSSRPEGVVDGQRVWNASGSPAVITSLYSPGNSLDPWGPDTEDVLAVQAKQIGFAVWDDGTFLVRVVDAHGKAALRPGTLSIEEFDELCRRLVALRLPRQGYRGLICGESENILVACPSISLEWASGFGRDADAAAADFSRGGASVTPDDAQFFRNWQALYDCIEHTLLAQPLGPPIDYDVPVMWAHQRP
jgi:hypothetical protein